jgi:hypothetical protein
MPASRKRKGHNKRIQKRKDDMKIVQNMYQKMFNEAMMTQIEELKKQHVSGNTETQQTPTADTSTVDIQK